MTSPIQKVLFTGKTHTRLSQAGSEAAKERLDIRLTTPNNPSQVHHFTHTQPHPTAEQLFAGAWSACYISALEVVAQSKQLTLPIDRVVEVEVDLGMAGSAYLLQARLMVLLPGLDASLAQEIAHEADQICPYSKATRGNIDVELKVFTS